MAYLTRMEQRKLENLEKDRKRDDEIQQKAEKEYTEYLEQNKINTQDIINEIKKFQKIEKFKLKFMEKERFELSGFWADMDGYKEYLKKEKYKSIDKVMNKFI
jgi:hypothetical protein